MRSWLAVLVVALGACNDHGAGALTKLKAEACACTTVACAEQVMQRVPKTNIDSNHRTQKLARDMLDCVAKLQAADRPETDPDAEGTAPTGSAPTTGSTATTGSAPKP